MCAWVGCSVGWSPKLFLVPKLCLGIHSKDAPRCENQKLTTGIGDKKGLKTRHNEILIYF